MIEIYFCKVQNLTISEFGKRMGKRSFNHRSMIQSMTAWSALEMILKEKHSIFLSEYKICFNINGKPYIENNIIYFNISHSDDGIVIGISDSEIGVDIEKIRKIKQQDAIAKRFFNEFDYNDYLKSSDKVDFFIKNWVIKETICKEKGKRLTDVNNLHPEEVNVERICDYYIGYANEKMEKTKIIIL